MLPSVSYSPLTTGTNFLPSTSRRIMAVRFTYSYSSSINIAVVFIIFSPPKALLMPLLEKIERNICCAQLVRFFAQVPLCLLNQMSNDRLHHMVKSRTLAPFSASASFVSIKKLTGWKPTCFPMHCRTIMASLAQQESQSLSQNVKIGLQYRSQQTKDSAKTSRYLRFQPGRRPH